MAILGNPARTREIIQKYGFHFQKKFGQNFLIDAHILEKIVDSAEVGEEDCVLEIGPGIGTMTQYLCERARKVIVVEIDKNLIPILEETLGDYQNVEIINADILKVDIQKIVDEHNGGKPIKVVANLPYYITTPILLSLLEKKLPLSSITVMVQKEVAERMQAGPGSKDYGALSLAVQYYSKPEIVQEVPPHCFIPRPKVSSMVIHLSVYKESPVECENPEYLFKTIKASFMQRRKTLVNALSAGLGIDKEVIKSVLSALSYPENVRGETLSLDEFAEISDNLDPEWREKQKSVFCRFCE